MLGLLHLRRQLRYQLQPRRHQFGTVRRQVAVPDVERLECTAVAPKACSRSTFQQRGALLKHLLVVGPERRHPGASQRRQLIEVAPPITGIAAHQGQH